MAELPPDQNNNPHLRAQLKRDRDANERFQAGDATVKAARIGPRYTMEPHTRRDGTQDQIGMPDGQDPTSVMDPLAYREEHSHSGRSSYKAVPNVDDPKFAGVDPHYPYANFNEGLRSLGTDPWHNVRKGGAYDPAQCVIS